MIQKTRQGNQFQTPFCFLKKLCIRQKKVVCSLISLYFDSPQISIQQKQTCLKLHTVDTDICSILIFQKRVWEQFLQHILCMIFQQKYSSCCILLTDQILLPDCLYFLRYWATYVLQLFVNQVVTSWILRLTLPF